MTIKSIAESRYATLWDQPVLKQVLNGLYGTDPFHPDHYRLDPLFSGFKFIYMVTSQTWWHSDDEPGFAKFDQVINAFNQDRLAKIDWEESKYWRNKPRVPTALTRDEHLEQAKTAVALAISQIDHRMGEVKEKMIGMAKELDKLGDAVTYKTWEEAIATGREHADSSF